MKKILVVNVNWVGDVLFSTPFLQALRLRFPESRIACLVVPRCREVLEGNPSLDELLIYDERGAHRFFWGKLRLIRMLQRRHFDRAYLLHRSFTRRLLVTLAGIPERIGYAIKWRGFLLTEKIPPSQEKYHKVAYFLKLLPEGTRLENLNYTLKTDESDHQAVGRLLETKGLRQDEPFIVFCPGGNWPPKRWPPENFAALGDRLIQQYHQKVVIVGAAKDLSLGEKIASGMAVKPVLLCGETTLKQLAALFKRASFVVSNDTGPMHVAQSQGARVIALFGPTDPELTGPWGTAPKQVLRKEVACNENPPCYEVNCPDNRCMQAIRLEDVLDAIQRKP
ncbi:MAG: lipopolysaccharide heptosyltransferase II [Candidatus Omnitrophota bacterium]